MATNAHWNADHDHWMQTLKGTTVCSAVPPSPINVLLIDDHGADHSSLRRAVAELGTARFELVSHGRIPEALQRSRGKSFDLIVLDFTRSATQLVKTLACLREQAPGVPILALPETEGQMGTSAESARKHASRDPLARAIRYAVQRHRMQAALAQWAFVDDLTGLYNRRCFWILADQHVKMAQRTKKPLLLIFADLDGLKQINDKFGHEEGDRALTQTAKILQKTFRDSDVVARMGGDEFIALTLEDSGQSAEAITARLQKNLKDRNGRGADYNLSLSIGVARSDPRGTPSLEKLIAHADHMLYQQKQKRQPVGLQSGITFKRSEEADGCVLELATRKA